MESVELPDEDDTPLEDAWRSEDEEEEDDEDEDDELSEEELLVESSEEVEDEEVEDEEDDDEPVSVLAVVSDCIVPTRANTPAAAASVTAAVAAAMRRLPLRTAVAAPLSLTVMTVPLRSDALSLTTVGDQPERSL